MVYDRIMDFPGYFRDHIMPDKIHILNVSFAVNGLKESFGGTAGNIAYNLALLGEKPTIFSTVGHDFAPYKKWLVKNKIDVSKIKIVKTKNTASCYITTDMSDNQITAFNPGALTEESFFGSPLIKGVRRILKDFGKINNPPNPLYQGGDFFAIIAPGNIKDMENYVRFYKKVGIKYIFDPGQAITALKPLALKNAVKGAEALIGNDYEVSLLSKKTGWTINNLIDKVNILIITKGEKGSEIYKGALTTQPPFTRGALQQFPAPKKSARGVIKAIKIPAVKPKKVVDPTGAGDAYRAGFIKGMTQGWDAKKCGQLASVVASFAVERYGTQAHRFSRKDLEERYKRSYGKDL